MKRLLVKATVGANSLAVAFQLMAIQALAQEKVNIPRPRLGNRNIGPSSVFAVVGPAVTIIFIIALILVFFFFLYGGVQWITSGGDKARTESARNTITAALIGLSIIALSYAIVRLVGTFFGVDIFGPTWNIPTAAH